MWISLGRDKIIDLFINYISYKSVEFLYYRKFFSFGEKVLTISTVPYSNQISNEGVILLGTFRNAMPWFIPFFRNDMHLSL